MGKCSMTGMRRTLGQRRHVRIERGDGVNMRGRLLFSRRSPVVALVIVLASAVTACGVPGIPSNSNVTPTGQTAKVQRSTIQTTVGASGVVLLGPPTEFTKKNIGQFHF